MLVFRFDSLTSYSMTFQSHWGGDNSSWEVPVQVPCLRSKSVAMGLNPAPLF